MLRRSIGASNYLGTHVEECWAEEDSIHKQSNLILKIRSPSEPLSLQGVHMSRQGSSSGALSKHLLRVSSAPHQKAPHSLRQASNTPMFFINMCPKSTYNPKQCALNPSILK
jgi:hypothetical protein